MFPGSSNGEWLAAGIGLAGLCFSIWAWLDDWADRRDVLRVGNPRGPRAIASAGNFYMNLTLTFAWSLFEYLAIFALYLPPRTDVPESSNEVGPLLRLLIGVLFLIAQIHPRVARYRMRKLPRAAWIEMIDEIVKSVPEKDGPAGKSV